MFGFGLKSKAKRVIREEFFYEVSYMYEPTFNAIYQQGKMLGQNEYSIAIFYMNVMMNVLIENNKEFGGDLSEIEHFISKHTSNINRILHQANSPESEIREMLGQINKEFKMIKESGEVASQELDSKNEDSNLAMNKETIKEANDVMINKREIKKVDVKEVGFMSMQAGEDVNKDLSFLNGASYECGDGSSDVFNDKTTNIIFGLGIDKLKNYAPPPHATFQKKDLLGKELYVIKSSEDQTSIYLVEVLENEIITIGISRTGNS